MSEDSYTMVEDKATQTEEITLRQGQRKNNLKFENKVLERLRDIQLQQEIQLQLMIDIQITIEEQQQEIQDLKKKKEDSGASIDMSQKNIDDLNREVRERTVEIYNIPFYKDEDKIAIVKDIYNILGLAFEMNMLVDIGRVYMKNDTSDTNERDNVIRPIMVELNSVQSKTMLLDAFKRYSKAHGSPICTDMLGIPGDHRPVHISGDNLYVGPKHFLRKHQYQPLPRK